MRRTYVTSWRFWTKQSEKCLRYQSIDNNRKTVTPEKFPTYEFLRQSEGKFEETSITSREAEIERQLTWPCKDQRVSIFPHPNCFLVKIKIVAKEKARTLGVIMKIDIMASRIFSRNRVIFSLLFRLTRVFKNFEEFM